VVCGGAAMEDILSQGGDREPSPWPRRLAVIGGALLVVVSGVVYFGFEHHRLSPAAAPSATASASARDPDGVGGADLPWHDSLRLPVAGTQPAWFSPATGRSVPIGGLPPDSVGYQFTRADGGWVVRAGSGGELASGDPAVPSLPVWFLADGAGAVTRVGTANQVTPAVTVGAVWLTSYPPTADPDTAVRMAREVSVDGAPMGASVRLPAGYAIYRATDRGLLLAPVSQRSGSQADRLWNPADPKASRAFDAVIAASPAEIAWMPECTGTCRVHVLDLETGRQTVVELPPGGFAASAAFSPSGGFLALQVMSDDGSEASAQLEVASASSGRLTALPGTSVGGDTVVDFGWPTSGDSLVAEFIYPDTVQVAAWHPGATGLAVAVVRSGQEQASLVVG
jgi:hypothetical protein